MVRRYAVPYQAISSKEWNSVDILGIATLIMLVSRAMRKAPKNRDVITIPSRHDER